MKWCVLWAPFPPSTNRNPFFTTTSALWPLPRTLSLILSLYPNRPRCFLGGRSSAHFAVSLSLLLPLRAHLRSLHAHLCAALSPPLPARLASPRLSHRPNRAAPRSSHRSPLEAARARAPHARPLRLPRFSRQRNARRNGNRRNGREGNALQSERGDSPRGPPFPRFSIRDSRGGERVGSVETAVFAVVLGVGSSEAFPAGLVGTQLMVRGTQILSPVVASDLLPRLSPEIAMSVGREFHRKGVTKRGNVSPKRSGNAR